MKKTLTVNLGGTVFHIDEDAYRLLDNYLCNLKLHFRKQEGAEEIVNDIENRISELFAEKLAAGSQVITITDVEEVIARMGKPEDFGEERRGFEPTTLTAYISATLLSKFQIGNETVTIFRCWACPTLTAVCLPNFRVQRYGFLLKLANI